MVSNNHSNTWIDITCPLSWEALTLRNGLDGRKEKPTFYNYLQINADALKCVSVDVANHIWHDHSKNVCILVKWTPYFFPYYSSEWKISQFCSFHYSSLWNTYSQRNSFSPGIREKTVILAVSMMGAINLALWPDVYYITFQSLEVLSRIDTCLFHAMGAWPPYRSDWDRYSIYIQKLQWKNFLEWFWSTLTYQLLSY